MTIETEIAGLTQATTDLLSAVNVRKATLDEKVGNADAFAQASLTSANNAAASATAANTSKTAAETAKTAAETARNAAVSAQNNAAAVVTGGTATLTPEAGKIPLADALGKINALWVALTALVEQSDIGTGPNQVPLNQFLGELAFMSRDQFAISPQASVEPTQVGSMVLQLTNNTTLIVKVKGTDGVVRSTTLILA